MIKVYEYTENIRRKYILCVDYTHDDGLCLHINTELELRQLIVGIDTIPRKHKDSNNSGYCGIKWLSQGGNLTRSLTHEFKKHAITNIVDITNKFIIQLKQNIKPNIVNIMEVN